MSQQAKYPAGPWKPACKTNSATCRHPAILHDGGQVGNATFQGSEPATDAAANMLAAAPDLLEALKVCASQSIGSDWTAEQALAFIRQHARAAIAKATGSAQ